MTSTATRRTLDLEQYLGPASSRFFSEGYKASSHAFSSLELSPDGLELAGEVTIDYASGWSQKQNIDQQPHLSTVDVMVIGVRCAVRLLRAAAETTTRDKATIHIEKIVVIAGTAPVEDLTGLPLTAKVLRTVTRDGNLTVHVETKVSSMTVRVAVCLYTDGTVQNSRALDSDYWDGGYRVGGHTMGPVRLEDSPLSAHSTLRSWRSNSSTASEPTYLDAFVVLMQLGQVLLYESDGITRAESNTLWMQQVVLTATSMRGGGIDSAEMRLVETEKIKLGTSCWTNATFQGEAAGFALSASFAHQLPETQNGENS